MARLLPLLALLAVPAAAQQARQLTEGSSASRAPAWSPDGSRIAFETDRAGNWDVYLLDLNDDQAIALTRRGEDERHPTWSPDGERIAFVDVGAAHSVLFVLDVASRSARSVAGVRGEALFPAWSPDGREIAFTQGYRESFRLLNLVIGEIEPRPLLAAAERDLWPRWSPDGRRVAFFSRRGAHPDDDEVYLIDRPSGRIARLTDRPGHDFCPAFSPAGDRLVMVSVEPDRSRALRIIDRAGVELARLAGGYHRVTEPVWSPDGAAIAYAAIRVPGEPYQLFVEPVPAIEPRAPASPPGVADE